MRHAAPILLMLAGLGLSACASGGPGVGVPIGTRTRLTCVPFAAEVSGISLPGDAWQWWAAARGHYARAHAPMIGSVLVFRPTAAMPDGHVAVVTAVLSRREILVAHANWTRGRINTGQPVIDVSSGNTWRAVRVWYPPVNQMGISTYRTYGFILPPSEPTPQDLEQRVATE
ncbi:MAG TPA: CHAP domain-containing protein [Acetobacteraceae bacterium]|nr:CHAP domain-containing protein [Acetobacteraceae bacterium]